MKIARTVAFAWLILVLPKIATAQVATNASAPPEKQGQWYGWQTLTVDGAALALAITGAVVAGESGSSSTQSVGNLMLLSAGAAYLVGAPAVHALHNEGWRVAGSLGLRAGLPIALAFTGYQMEDCRRGSDLCGLGGALLGFGTGMAAAIALDAALLAREGVPADERRTIPASFSFRVTPTVSPDAKHAGFAVSGAF